MQTFALLHRRLTQTFASLHVCTRACTRDCMMMIISAPSKRWVHPAPRSPVCTTERETAGKRSCVRKQTCAANLCAGVFGWRSSVVGWRSSAANLRVGAGASSRVSAELGRESVCLSKIDRSIDGLIDGDRSNTQTRRRGSRLGWAANRLSWAWSLWTVSAASDGDHRLVHSERSRRMGVYASTQYDIYIYIYICIYIYISVAVSRSRGGCIQHPVRPSRLSWGTFHPSPPPPPQHMCVGRRTGPGSLYYIHIYMYTYMYGIYVWREGWGGGKGCPMGRADR